MSNPRWSSWIASYDLTSHSNICQALPTGAVGTLARQRILPVLSPGAGTMDPSPLLRANACWALGELSTTEVGPARYCPPVVQRYEAQVTRSSCG
jgi:hypothetical protein